MEAQRGMTKSAVRVARVATSPRPEHGATLLHALLRGAPAARRRRKGGTFRRAQHAIVARARRLGLIDAAPVAAVDATGLEARHVSLYYRVRRGEAKRPRHRRRAWPKLTAVVHVRSHLIVGAVTGRGPTQDSPEFTPALRQAVRVLRLDTVLGDAGYDAEHNHRLCREALGVRQTVINLNPRNVGRRWPATPYRREMRRRFPRALYHQRWHAESAF